MVASVSLSKQVLNDGKGRTRKHGMKRKLLRCEGKIIKLDGKKIIPKDKMIEAQS